MSVPPIYIVSGGLGSSGAQLVRTALAQFNGSDVPVIIVPGVRNTQQIEEAVTQAAIGSGTIVHTLVDAALRQELAKMARDRNVEAIDLMGPLLSRFSTVLDLKPLGQPGLYHQLREEYFDRMDAIEFSVAHDDGRNPQDWRLAEIMLVGVSRVGKTPLSMYLSVRGWKVANVPIVQGIDLPDELFKLDPHRVVGLTVDPSQLIAHRRLRQQRLGMPQRSAYSNLEELYTEVEAAQRLLSRAGFAMINVTDKPIEESADEVIALVTQRTKDSTA